MQFQSDILNQKVVVSDIEEISALGSVFMAGLAFGFWKDLEDISTLRKSGKTFEPKIVREEITELYNGWKRAVAKSLLK